MDTEIENFEDKEPINLEQAFGDLLGGGMDSQGVDGDAQLLEVASKHTLQLNAEQIKAILYLNYLKDIYLTNEKEKVALNEFIKTYVQYTSHNSSQGFITEILGAISFRRFINENTLKINVGKNA